MLKGRFLTIRFISLELTWAIIICAISFHSKKGLNDKKKKEDEIKKECKGEKGSTVLDLNPRFPA